MEGDRGEGAGRFSARRNRLRTASMATSELIDPAQRPVTRRRRACAARCLMRRSATTSSATTRRSTGCRRCWRNARLRGGAVHASGTQSKLAALMTHCGAATSIWSGRTPTPTLRGRRAAVLGSIQPQPLENEATARSCWSGSPRRSSLTTRTSRARGCWRWRTPSAARCCRCVPACGDDAGARARLATHLDGARLFNAATALAWRRARSPPASTRCRCA